MNQPAAPVDSRPPAKAATALVILAIGSATAMRQALSPLQELVRIDLGLSDNQIALLQGLAVALPLVLFSLPLGRLVDRANRSRILFAFTLLGGIGSGLTAFAHSYAEIFATRMLVGLSYSAVSIAALSLVADLSSMAARGRYIMLVVLGQVFGGGACFAMAGALIDRLPTALHGLMGTAAPAPWRLVQAVFAVGLVVIALVLLLLREPVRRELGEAANGNTKAALRELWRYRKILGPLMVGMLTINMADAASEIWAVPVLTRVFHQQPGDFGGWMATIAVCAGIGGAIAGGFLSDIGQRLAGRGGILVGALLGAVLSIPGSFYPLMPSVQLFAVFLAIFLLAGACTGTAATAAVAVLIPNEVRGLTAALFGTVSIIASYGIAPLLVSTAAGHMGSDGDIAVPLTAIACATSVIGSLAYVIAMRDARTARRRETSTAAAVSHAV